MSAPRWKGPAINRGNRGARTTNQNERERTVVNRRRASGWAIFERSAEALTAMQDAEERILFSKALGISVVAHILLFTLMIVNLGGNSRIGEGIVYSVSIEGGKSLGGVGQVAKNTKEAPIAPPKNTSAAETEKADEKAKAEKDAEISLAEKKKEEQLKKKQEEEAKKKAEEELLRKKKQEDLRKKPAPPKEQDINKDYQKALQRYLGESTEAGGKGFGAGKITGGKGMGGGVQMPPEFFTYRQMLRNKVKSGWNWYNTNAALTTWVTFKIARDGVVSDVRLAETSGNREFDDSVIRAIYKASPLPPPPSTVYDTFKEVKMSFDPRE